MGVFCVVCDSVVPGDIDAFRKHLLKRCHLPPYKCAEGDCDNLPFVASQSLIRHLRQKHSSALRPDPYVQENIQENVAAVGNVVREPNKPPFNIETSEDEDDPGEEIEFTNEDEAEDNEMLLTGFNKNMKHFIARMVLNLRKKGNITGTAISEMLTETSVLLKDTVGALKQVVVSHLESVGVQKEITDEIAAMFQLPADPCAGLKRKEQQMTYFKENFGLVLPAPAFMGSFRYDQRLEPGTSDYTEKQIPKTYQYVSVIDTLTEILNNPLFFKMIHEENPSADGRIRSYLDGNRVQKNELIKKYPHTIRIVKYADELECANALGSKTIIHQIMGLYYLVQNLPPEENSRLRSIHVSSYGHTADFDPVIEVDSMLDEFFRELNRLECEDGVLIQVNGEPYVLRATLIALAADTKAAHQMMGLLSPSAKLFCRECTVTRPQMHQNILAIGEDRTNDLHFDHITHVERNGKSKKAQKETGVRRDCMMRTLCKFPQVPQMAVFDPMHDILEGVAKRDIKVALREFIVVKRFLSIDLFNARIQSFNYGLMDHPNKPSANFTEESLQKMGSYNLLQTASQSWCLLRVFPFIVCPEVPEDNEHLQLVVLLKRASEIIFSSSHSEDDLQRLDKHIVEHHELFFKLYPPSQGQEAVVEEEEDVDDPNGEAEEEEERGEEGVDDPTGEVEEDSGDEGEENDRNGRRRRRKKKPKIIRPINKDHHLLHYAKKIRDYGPIILYLCMRFEGKHAIAKKYAQICCNFTHLDLTLAHMHQINHCAELLEAKVAVRDQIKFSKGLLWIVAQTQYSQALQDIGLGIDTAVKVVDSAVQGGFHYRKGLLVVLPYQQPDSLPVFASILQVVQHQQEIVIVVEDYLTLKYDTAFGAYAIEKNNDHLKIHAYYVKTLPPERSMSPWLRYDNNSVLYVSPRSSFIDTLFSNDEESQD